MKRITIFLMTIGIILSVNAQSAIALISNDTLAGKEVTEDREARLKEISFCKEVNREVNVRLTEYESKGYDIIGISFMKNALTTHFSNLIKLEDNGREICGISYDSKSKYSGWKVATENALLFYAKNITNNLRDKVKGNVKEKETTNEKLDKFYATFENTFINNLKVTMPSKYPITESYVIYKQLDNGNYEVQSFLIVDERAINPILEKTLNEALKDTSLPREYEAKLRKVISVSLN